MTTYVPMSVVELGTESDSCPPWSLQHPRMPERLRVLPHRRIVPASSSVRKTQDYCFGRGVPRRSRAVLIHRVDESSL